MSMKFRVVVDEREKPSGVPDLLKESGLQVEYKVLEVGDYVVSWGCAVERKGERDFGNLVITFIEMSILRLP